MDSVWRTLRFARRTELFSACGSQRANSLVADLVETSHEHAVIRKWVTVFLALSVWYAFVIGHVANDFRGVGS
jgi:hypothetical protein